MLRVQIDEGLWYEKVSAKEGPSVYKCHKPDIGNFFIYCFETDIRKKFQDYVPSLQISNARGIYNEEARRSYGLSKIDETSDQVSFTVELPRGNIIGTDSAVIYIKNDIGGNHRVEAILEGGYGTYFKALVPLDDPFKSLARKLNEFVSSLNGHCTVCGLPLGYTVSSPTVCTSYSCIEQWRKDGYETAPDLSEIFLLKLDIAYWHLVGIFSSYLKPVLRMNALLKLPKLLGNNGEPLIELPNGQVTDMQKLEAGVRILMEQIEKLGIARVPKNRLSEQALHWASLSGCCTIAPLKGELAKKFLGFRIKNISQSIERAYNLRKKTAGKTSRVTYGFHGTNLYAVRSILIDGPYIALGDEYLTQYVYGRGIYIGNQLSTSIGYGHESEKNMPINTPWRGKVPVFVFEILDDNLDPNASIDPEVNRYNAGKGVWRTYSRADDAPWSMVHDERNLVPRFLFFFNKDDATREVTNFNFNIDNVAARSADLLRRVLPTYSPDPVEDLFKNYQD